MILLSNTHANNKDKIIENLQNTENFNFKFEQNINGKIENGNCTIQYPKKIYCKYLNKDKILVKTYDGAIKITHHEFKKLPKVGEYLWKIEY